MWNRILDLWDLIYSWRYSPSSCFYETRIGQWWCGRHGHAGVVWYSFGSEPDMHCNRCGKDLG